MPTTTKKYAVIFTDREIEMVKMISKGYSRTEIAECYFLTLKSINFIFADIQNRIQAKSTAHLVGIMFRDNLIN